MEDDDFSDDFCRFIQEHLPSVDAAELLLVLSSQQGRYWSVPELVGKLRPASAITDAEATRCLDHLRARGLVVVDPDSGVHYSPHTETFANHVKTLEQAYRERPVTLIRMIYALRDKKIQSFAEAFNLRRK